MIAHRNQVVITHLGEPCVFDIEKCKLSISEAGLDLDVFTNPNRDCPLGHLSAPTIHIESGSVGAKSLEALTAEELDVAMGWDTDEETQNRNIFRIYISQHEALNNNRVKITRNQDKEIEIRWQAEARDFLDIRNPGCKVDVYCVIEAGSKETDNKNRDRGQPCG
ncbi:MAG: hypothetical protein JNM43_21855 [Planctomycetaceae bacterium]|nr:hypothetical protein [Planctomycetaceae bacterium]